MMNFLKKNKSYKNSAEDKLDLIISLLTGECKNEPAEAENENQVENAEETSSDDSVDKRQEIEDVGGFLKSKGLSDEDIRYVIKLMEKDAYEKSSYENGSEPTKEEKPTEEQTEEPKETTTVSQEQVNQETQQETKEETIQQPIKEAEKKEYENSFEGETNNNNFLLLKDRVKYGNSLF